jgi:hypothetical protein
MPPRLDFDSRPQRRDSIRRTHGPVRICPADEKTEGCPIFRALCERWERRTPGPKGFIALSKADAASSSKLSSLLQKPQARSGLFAKNAFSE